MSCVRVTRCCVELGVSLGDMCLKLYVVSGSRAVSCVRVTLSRELDVSLGDMCLNLYSMCQGDVTRHVSGLQDVLHLYVFLIIFTEISVPEHKKSKSLEGYKKF